MNLSSWTSLFKITPDWLVAVMGLILTGAVALALVRPLHTLLRRSAPFRSPFAMMILSSAKPILGFAFVILMLVLVVPALPLPETVSNTLNHFMVAALILLSGWVAMITCNLAIERYIRRYDTETPDNLLARKAVTQIRILKRVAQVVIIVISAGFALMTFDGVRQVGISLFASAGIAGLALGLAAKPLLGNLIAGLQIAITQPIRIDDAVVVEGEWGWIEEFSSTYVVIRLWDWRRLVVPLGYFLEKPFQNWTRTSSSIIGTVLFHLDYRTPVQKLRETFIEMLKQSSLWDGQVASLQVTDTSEHTIEVRALMSAKSSPLAFDLRCEIREKMLAFLQKEFPESLPRLRANVIAD